MRVRVDGYHEDGVVWCPAMISCPDMVEQLGLFVICMHHGECSCYLNGTPLRVVPVVVSHGDFLAIYKSDGSRAAPGGLVTHATASGRRTEHTSIASSLCSGQGAESDGASPTSTAHLPG